MSAMLVHTCRSEKEWDNVNVWEEVRKAAGLGQLLRNDARQRCREKVSEKSEHYLWYRSLWNTEEGVQEWCWSMDQYHPPQFCHVPASKSQSIQGNDLLNYKSLDCYQTFFSGWVGEVLVMSVVTDSDLQKKRVVTAKVFWQYGITSTGNLLSNITVAGESLPRNERRAADTLGCNWAKWQDFVCPLWL